jgi:hypothetical protein
VHPSWNTTTPWASIQDPVLWLRCGTDRRDCTTVQPGGLDYQVASGDVGHRLRVVFEESRLRTADGTMIGAASAPTPVITGS